MDCDSCRTFKSIGSSVKFTCLRSEIFYIPNVFSFIVESESVLDPEGRAEWCEWLHRNHDREKEIWLIIHKKHADAKGVNLKEAVEEAICFGWIDSKMKRINDETFILKFSPRSTDSLWSKINREGHEIDRFWKNDSIRP